MPSIRLYVLLATYVEIADMCFYNKVMISDILGELNTMKIAFFLKKKNLGSNRECRQHSSYPLTGHFIGYTCTDACQLKSLISRSHGNISICLG